eukprot:5024392-Lingulodinium_polyedra.AAC.1
MDSHARVDDGCWLGVFEVACSVVGLCEAHYKDHLLKGSEKEAVELFLQGSKVFGDTDLLAKAA